MTTTKHENRTAYRSVHNIASLQRERAQILNDAANAVRRIDEQIAQETNFLLGLLRREPTVAGLIAGTARDTGLNAGDLNSHFADEVERCGHRLYPAPYEPIRSAWALVTNDYR